MGVKPKTISNAAGVLRALWQAGWYLLCSCVTNVVHASRTSNVESIMFGKRVGDGESRLRFFFVPTFVTNAIQFINYSLPSKTTGFFGLSP